MGLSNTAWKNLDRRSTKNTIPLSQYYGTKNNARYVPVFWDETANSSVFRTQQVKLSVLKLMHTPRVMCSANTGRHHANK